MSKLNEILDDAFVNATGLKKQPKEEKAPEPIVDDLEDIDEAPEAEEELEAPETPKSLDPRLLDIFKEALISDKDLRAAARDILEQYPDKPKFTWVYQMQRGPKTGKTFVGTEAAVAAIPKTAREYVKLDEVFIRTLCKLNEDGTPGEEATREEYEEYVAEMAAADQSTADSTESGTTEAD